MRRTKEQNNEHIFESIGENTPPENYVLMDYQDGDYCIYEVHRNDRIKKKQSKDIEQSIYGFDKLLQKI